jgi:hypothetical protein
LRTGFAFLAPLSSWAGRAGRAFVARHAARSRIADSAGEAGCAVTARWTRWPFYALRAGRTCFALRTCFAFLAPFPDWASGAGSAGKPVGTIAQLRQARLDRGFELVAQLGDLGAQLGNRRARLRLDQLALALPLAPLIVEDFGKRFAPRVN